MDISKEQQIESLLNNTAYELARKVYGRPEIKQTELQQIFNINRKDIFEHINKHGLKSILVHNEHGRSDGVYLIRILFFYFVYHQEREIKFERCFHFTFQSAQRDIIDRIINGAGLNLN